MFNVSGFKGPPEILSKGRRLAANKDVLVALRLCNIRDM